MRITLQLIENYTPSIPSIVITANNQRYIFNVPETFQRFSRQHRFKYNKGSVIFFTKTSSATVTGLLGLMLTLAEQGQSFDTKMYMIPRLFDYFSQIRYQKGMKILPYGMMDWSGRYQQGIGEKSIDQLLKKPNFPYLFHHIQQYIQKLPKQQINKPQMYFKQTHFEDQNLKIIPIHIKADTEITQYVCLSNKIPGKVNSQKLKQFGITGKNIGKFMADGEFTLENGVKVFSNDFREEEQLGSVFMILHFDNERTLKETIENVLFKQYCQESENIIYIIEDPSIIESNTFKSFINVFNQQSHHLLYCQQYKDNKQFTPELTRHYKLTNQLSSFFPKQIPPIQTMNKQNILNNIKSFKIIQELFPEKNIEMYKRYYELVITPRLSKSYTNLKSQIAEQEPIKGIEFEQPFSTQKLWDFNKVDPLVVFLGTGSMKPSTYRNVSGIYVEFNKSSMILDCGEGTYMQLLNHFGPAVEKVLLSLKVIFITHVHSDHHLGILNLISERRKLCEKYNVSSDDLFLIVPYNLAPAVWAYDEYVERLNCSTLFIQTLKGQSYEIQGNMSKDERKCYKLDVNDISTEHYSTPKQKYILHNYFANQSQVLAKFEQYLVSEKIVEFNPCHVIHCPQSYGIIIKHESGVKISYSGDTRPCTEFINASTNSTLMIHQATFGDDLEDNAKQNYHSTVGQAIYSGMKSNSWRLALTHFSQRYKNSASILDLEGYKNDEMTYNYAKDNTIVCFDHLQMKMSETEYMPEVSRLIAEVLPTEKTQK